MKAFDVNGNIYLTEDEQKFKLDHPQANHTKVVPNGEYYQVCYSPFQMILRIVKNGKIFEWSR